MRPFIVIIAILAMVCPATSHALTGLSVGGKVGYANYTGDVLPSSGDVGSDVSYAVIMGFSTLPVLDFELRAGYFTKDFDYSYSAGGATVTVPFEYRDVSVTAFVKKNIFAPMASPIAMYVGAGVGMHWINTEVVNSALNGSVDLSAADNQFTLLSNTGKMSTEGVLGLRASLPAFPLSFFGEGRYGVVFGTERIGMAEYAGGVMLNF